MARRRKGWTATMDQRIFCLDLETYYDKSYTLRKLSTVEYIKHDKFKVHGLAVQYPDGETAFVPETEIQGVLDSIQPEDIVLAHNWAFDGLALAYHYGWRHRNVTDTRLLANAVLGPAADRGRSNSLGDLAEELGLEAKGRLDPMEGVLDPSEEQWEYLSAYAEVDARLTRQVYNVLRPRLSRPGLELWLMRFSLDLFINKPIKVSASHVKGAVEECCLWKRKTLDRVMKPREGDKLPLVKEEIQLSSQLQFAAILEPLCEEAGLELPMKESAPSKVTGETRMIPALAKRDEGFQALRVCGVPEIEDLMNARLVQRSATTVMARLKKLVGNPLAHMSFNYHGCVTGRPSGGGNGWNPLNIPSVGRAVDEESRMMAKGIRSCLRAPKGYTFVHVDASQIECRFLAWFAGQWDIVDAFGEGADLYSDFIGDVIGETVYKADADDPSYRKMTALRNVGKECIAEGEPVLTDRGFIPIQEVKLRDRVWDGNDWVEHDGVKFMGHRQCIKRGGIWLTDDHEMLTTEGWVKAGDIGSGHRRPGTISETGQLNLWNWGLEVGLSPSHAAAYAELLRRATNATGCSISDTRIVGSADGDVRESRPTYDIVNAGPRHRYQVRQSIVANCILGLGYSLGWYKLRQRLKEHPQAQDIRDVLGPRLNDGFVKNLVAGYREKYDAIPELWEDLDDAFHVARRGGRSEVGMLGFESEKPFESLHMILPSGRKIRYSGFKKVLNKQGYKEWVWGRGRRIYGGLVTENACQATSWDHLVDCIYAMEQMDYKVVLSVYDSIIACVPKERAEQCLADCVGMLSEAPSWGPELRLDAEGHISPDFN